MRQAVFKWVYRSAGIRFLLLFAITLAIGIPVMRWLAEKKQARYRDELLSDVAVFARAINRERIQTLTYTASDAQLAEYHVLCDQLRAFISTSRFRDAYCVGQRDGAFVFGPSSYAWHAGDGAMAVGTPVAHPPAELARAFETKLAQVTGPLAEPGGTFAYAIMPVLGMRDNRVLFALVAQVDGSTWYMGLAKFWVGPILFAGALFLVVAVGMGVLRWYTRCPRLRHGLIGHCEMLLVATVGLIFTLIVTWIVRDAERQVRRLSYQAYVRRHSYDLINTVRALSRRLESIARLLASETRITQQSFVHLIETNMAGSSADSWLWVPAIRQAELEPALASARSEMGEPFLFWQAEGEAGRAQARGRALYCPVLYGEPARSSVALLGYDLCSEPGLRPALEAAASSGMLAASEVISLPSAAGGGRVLVLLQPVCSPRAEGGALRGYLAALVSPRAILTQAFAVHSEVEMPELKAELYQLYVDRQAVFLASTSSEQQPRSLKLLQPSERGAYSLSTVVPVFELGKSFSLIVRAGPAYFATHTLWLYQITAFAGALLTALLTFFVGYLTNRRITLEDQISVRTLELERVGYQLTTILDAAADGILGLDREGNCVVVNLSAAEMLGYDLSEMIGQPSHRIWQHDSSESAPGALEECPIYTTYKYGTQCRKPDALFWRKDGASFHVAFVSKPIYQQDVLSGAVVSFRDISGQRDADKKLIEAYRKVERINRELQEAGQVKNQFLAHMSHEIRTPLNCIIGMTGLLLSTRLDDEQVEFAETIRLSGESLLDIVNEILDFSKIEAKKMELEKQPFDLRHCVEDAVDLVASSAAKKGLEVTYLIEETLHNWWVGDATRIRQILVNLLGNAVKFTDQGEVDLTVSGRPNDDGCYSITFSVRDTGVGVPPERLDRLFHSFSQVDVSVSRRFGGTGLGLAISKRLCELMGGAMSVESSGVPGQGSTFRFSIPLVPDYSLRSLIEHAVATSTVMGKKALVVERNATSRETLSQQLKSLGVACVVVDSVPLALQRLRAVDLFDMPETFDVAIIDMQFTDTDSRPLGLAMRELPQREKLPLILLSPLGAHVESTPALNNVAHVTKPVKLSLLYEALMKVLASHQATRRVTPAPYNPYDSAIGKRHALRILLAEDNVVNQKVATRILSKIGYRADVVSNGLEALEALHRTPYDVVLMDVQMPEMDGEQASIRIRQEIPAGRQPWIVAMTAHAMNGDRERYQAAGMNDYIPKPIRVERLIEVLQSIQPLSQRTGLEALPS